MESESESLPDTNIFYFESDHLALRGNRDYLNMLRTIAVLEAQKVRVLQHIEELALAKKRYLDEPEIFLSKIKNNEELISPNYMTIATIPEISHYDDMPAEDEKIKEEPDISTADNKLDVGLNIGRAADETKLDRLNQLWTVEEQKRLEELLIKYPEERIEMHRFSKIAKALGNRTPRQVSSRVQKYFQKLHSAGMPIPGRIPKNRRVGQPKSKQFYRPSTFFPSRNVPVHMSEDDFLLQDLHVPSADTTSNEAATRSNSIDTISDIKTEPISLEVQKQIVALLKIIRQEKLSTPEGYNPDPMASKCESCQFAAVSRLRFRCNTCYCSLNLCADCLVHKLVNQKFDHFLHDVVAESEM